MQTDSTTPWYDASSDTGVFESFYLQDDITLSKALVLNVGARFDATQFIFSGTQSSDWMVQPCVGLNCC